MSAPRKDETVKERVERLLQIDIYKQAKRPRAEVRRELKKLGIDAGDLAKRAIELTREALKKSPTGS